MLGVIIGSKPMRIHSRGRGKSARERIGIQPSLNLSTSPGAGAVLMENRNPDYADVRGAVEFFVGVRFTNRTEPKRGD